jgi:hypothetical protein
MVFNGRSWLVLHNLPLFHSLAFLGWRANLFIAKNHIGRSASHKKAVAVVVLAVVEVVFLGLVLFGSLGGGAGADGGSGGGGGGEYGGGPNRWLWNGTRTKVVESGRKWSKVVESGRKVVEKWTELDGIGRKLTEI